MKQAFTPATFLKYARRGALLLALGAAVPAARGQSFGPATTYTAANTYSDAFGLATGDVNGDGRLDIVTVSSSERPNNYSTTTGTIGVLLGQASGGFAVYASYSLGTNPDGFYYSVVLGDVNGDGHLDIVTVRNASPGYAMVLPGQGDGTFGPAASYLIGTGSAYSVTLGDVNNDGRLDIVARNIDVASPSGYQIAVLLGQATRGFATATNYPIGSSTVIQSIAVGDVNGDGRPDIVTTGGRQDVIVLLGQAIGFAAATTYSLASDSYPRSVVLGDVNRDGRVDIVTTAGALLGQTGGGFQAPITYSTGSNRIALGDVNGDGRPDLVSTNSILLGQATGFALPVAFTTALNAYDIALGDANGDGRLDIVTTSTNNANVFLNTGTYTPLATTHPTTADIALYPNPAHASFTVQLPAAFGPAQAELLNALGQIVSRPAAAGPSFRLIPTA